MSDAAEDDWKAILDPGETLLWVGTPVTGVRFTGKTIATSLFGLLVFVFSVFWIVGAALKHDVFVDTGEGPRGLNWFSLYQVTSDLLFLATGAYILFGHLLLHAYLRSRTRYALTDRRAIITSWAGRKRSLKSFPIMPDTVIDYQPGDEATIHFATETTVDGDGDHKSARVGFEHTPDGATAHATIRRIQAEAA